VFSLAYGEQGKVRTRSDTSLSSNDHSTLAPHTVSRYTSKRLSETLVAHWLDIPCIADMIKRVQQLFLLLSSQAQQHTPALYHNDLSGAQRPGFRGRQWTLIFLMARPCAAACGAE
jgi:hypothetical protein